MKKVRFMLVITGIILFAMIIYWYHELPQFRKEFSISGNYLAPRGVLTTKNERCKRCGSMRLKTNTGYSEYRKGNTPVRYQYKSPAFRRCHHQWIEGWPSTGVDVKENQIVLVKKGPILGAVIIMEQNKNMFRYAWYYRSDGNGTFVPSRAPGLKSGIVHSMSERTIMFPPLSGGRLSKDEDRSVKFDPIELQWDVDSERLYYLHWPGDEILPDDVLFCITHERDISKINAKDRKWIYKGSPVDPGVYADGTPAH